jgi:transcriptional regulator with XRE-family HTH domain
MSSQKTPHIIDLTVGANIRRRRRAIRLSQEGLATAIGITFQQVQKYERGANRVNASMLYEISRILECQAADLIPHNADASETPDWMLAAQTLNNRHPRLLEQLLKWPEDQLSLFMVAAQALLPPAKDSA